MFGTEGLDVTADEEEVDFCGSRRGVSSYRIVDGRKGAMAAPLDSNLKIASARVAWLVWIYDMLAW